MIKKNKNESLSRDAGSSLLNDYHPSFTYFENIEKIIKAFRKPDVLDLPFRKRFKLVNQKLCELVLNAPKNTFLLNAVLDFFDRINQEDVLQTLLDFSSFEFWLNHFSGFSESDNYQIRAKIVGRYLPREEYQSFFPIGMDKTYFGTHFVNAHLSPDIDTMMASFWGWMDAFGARVGSSLHLWSLPGGPPDSPVTSFFSHLFGQGVFPYIARTTPELTLTAMDLLTQSQLIKESGSTLVSSIDHGPDGKAVILVNEQGHYLGDWCSSDVELINQVVILFKGCFHAFENNVHLSVISLFANPHFSSEDVSCLEKSIFDVKIKDCEAARAFSEMQQKYLHDFLVKILGVEKGADGTFRDLNLAYQRLSQNGLINFQNEIKSLKNHFDAKGCLKQDRQQIFSSLKELVKCLDLAILEARHYVERLDVALKIKHQVFELPQTYITLQSDVEEIRQKMVNKDYLTVAIYEKDGSLFPVGIVKACDLREQGLGTVSLRDFSNLEEMRMASYLDIISIVDHHKSSVKTMSVPAAIIGDAQSSNVLIAEQAFAINDKYSLGGMNLEQIEQQLKDVAVNLNDPKEVRIFQRLLQRRMTAQQKHSFYVHPGREFSEYLCYLHAIIDDTDLLSKVSQRDILCVAQLLNRLKSLSLGREVEIIQLDDIPRDKKFAKTAAKRILQQEDMYSLYRHIYSLRESEVESNLDFCVFGKPSNIFLDTKEQNGCARVGQTKVFTSNFPSYLKRASKIRSIWLQQSEEVFRKKPEVDLYIHMISTIAGAEEVYQDQVVSYAHEDELWLWTPSTPCGYRHLNSFLSGFQHAIKNLKINLSLELLDNPSEEFINLFNIHFPDILKKEVTTQTKIPMAVLRYKAGSLNSRKSMISPFLPRLG